MERRLKCGVCAAAALALVLCFGMEQKNRAMQTAGNAQTTLVIDAGHGGFDGGAVGADGTAEQDINLSIANRHSRQHPIPCSSCRDIYLQYI